MVVWLWYFDYIVLVSNYEYELNFYCYVFVKKILNFYERVMYVYVFFIGVVVFRFWYISVLKK